ncbi:hypothetical protein BJX70DRAFT_361963 [Aspergillus crustosus]
MEVIDIDRWTDNDYDKGIKFSYEKHAEEVVAILKKALVEARIQHVISSRLKTPDSLRAKLRKMESENHIRWTAEMIFQRVFDIAGVRIALYIPGQESLVKEIIEIGCGFIFTDYDTKSFGKEGASISYKATHWVVRLANRDFDKPVEVQVTSVLGSAWAHIEHDYTYKKLKPDVSPAERTTLYAFEQAVKLSENLLERLGKLRSDREDESFETIYDLGGFLSQWWRENHGSGFDELGSLDALLRLLKSKDMQTLLNSRGRLNAFLTKHITCSAIKEAEQQLFPDMKVRPVVIILYHVIKKNRPSIHLQWPQPHRLESGYSLKLHVIMSTVLWLSDLFPPSDWEKPLRPKITDRQQNQQLAWLNTSRPGQLTKNRMGFKGHLDDRQKVDDLWELFDKLESPAVKLALDISKADFSRTLEPEVDRFTRVFSTLGQALENESSSS